MTKHTILFLAANPVGTDRLALDEEARAIRVALERSSHRDQFQLEMRVAARPLDLLDELRKLKPTIVHFSGHGGRGELRQSAGARRDIVAAPGADESSALDGDQQHGLFFQGSDGGPQLVSAAALEETFGAAGSSVKLVLLSACYSEMQAEVLLAHVGCVVGMGGSIRDDAARNFAIGFYGGLCEGESIAAAHRQGRAAVSLEGLIDNKSPQLKARDDIDPDKYVLVAELAASATAVNITNATVSAGLSSQCEVLLCHDGTHHVDNELVQGIAKHLRAVGLNPWLDREQLRPGLAAARGLQAQVGTVKAAVVFVGASGIGSWQDVGILALLGNLVERGCRVVPVLLPNCLGEPPLSPFPGTSTWVDLRLDLDPVGRVYLGITGKELRPGSGAVRRGWTWYSSVQSAEAGKISVLATIETIAATTVYAWIAWRFGTIHLTISACVAPLLLLRTQDSALLALKWSSLELHSYGVNWTPFTDDLDFKTRARKYLARILLLPFSVYVLLAISLITVVSLMGKRAIATMITVVKSPLKSIGEIPRNWWYSIACIDSYHPLEILPGAYRRIISTSTVLPFELVIYNLRKIVHSDDPILLRALNVTILIPPALLLLLPALFYRWSLKGVALIYSPLIWVAHGATARSLSEHLDDILTLRYYRYARGFAVFVLLLFMMKFYLYYAWSDFALWWHALPGYRLLDAVVMPDAFPPWQITSTINATLAWGLYLAADWAAARLHRGVRINEKVIELTLRWVSLLRGVLAVYTIICGIYLAASLAERFGLPAMGTRILPWQ